MAESRQEEAKRHGCEIWVPGSDAMLALGAALGSVLPPDGSVVLLRGPLGAGKTTLAQGIGRGLGVTDRIVSPSFTLMREYPVPGSDARLVHADFYRLSGAGEVWAIGIEDHVREGDFVVVEWPERAGAGFAPHAIVVDISLDEEGRTVLPWARSATGRAVVEAWLDRARREPRVDVREPSS